MTNEKPVPTVRFRKVLIVEDNVSLRALISDVLRDANLKVIETANADDAMEVLRTDPVELVFADIRLPGSMDGVALARRIQSEFPQTRIVLTSGRRKPEDKIKGVAFVQKPYVFSTVLKKIMTALNDS